MNFLSPVLTDRSMDGSRSKVGNDRHLTCHEGDSALPKPQAHMHASHLKNRSMFRTYSTIEPKTKRPKPKYIHDRATIRPSRQLPIGGAAGLAASHEFMSREFRRAKTVHSFIRICPNARTYVRTCSPLQSRDGALLLQQTTSDTKQSTSTPLGRVSK